MSILNGSAVGYIKPLKCLSRYLLGIIPKVVFVFYSPNNIFIVKAVIYATWWKLEWLRTVESKKTTKMNIAALSWWIWLSRPRV